MVDDQQLHREVRFNKQPWRACHAHYHFRKERETFHLFMAPTPLGTHGTPVLQLLLSKSMAIPLMGYFKSEIRSVLLLSSGVSKSNDLTDDPYNFRHWSHRAIFLPVLQKNFYYF